MGKCETFHGYLMRFQGWSGIDEIPIPGGEIPNYGNLYFLVNVPIKGCVEIKLGNLAHSLTALP
jgi:hypothetical protein